MSNQAAQSKHNTTKGDIGAYLFVKHLKCLASYKK